MSFQHCVDCKEPVTFKTKFKSVFFGYKPITCPKCGTVHEVDERYRFLFSLYTVVIPIMLVYFVSAAWMIESRFQQVLLVLMFGIVGVLFAAKKIKFHKAKFQPKELEELEKKNKK
ncbi:MULTISPECIES: TIGR04104 family putative zinc finger protein [Bacillus]|uniref:TIGR04104 family putative zinc finger protein n=1 Tax=Bacillus TaxID=1386 RepID=UPI000BB7EA34|nr:MULTISPECIES: TIGR04104 family putative zinc finger protein [Bacillus]